MEIIEFLQEEITESIFEKFMQILKKEELG